MTYAILTASRLYTSAAYAVVVYSSARSSVRHDYSI